MLKFAIIFFTILLNSQISFGQFKNLSQFIPSEFTILDSASGDLNKDGINDLVLILRNNYEMLNSDTTRSLLLLQGNKVGQV